MYAYGAQTRRRVISALANLRNFQGNGRHALSEGLTGLNGPCRHLLPIRYGALPREYALGLDTAQYVVYCYGTPIAWVTADDEDATEDRNNWIPDWQYSPTTTYYQGLVMEAWGKYSDPDPRKSRRDNRGSARGRSSDERYGRRGPVLENTPARDYAATLMFDRGEVQRAVDEGASRFRTNHRGVRYDALVERDTSFERDMAEARSGYPNGLTEDEQSRTLRRLLDRRYADPDWVPDRDERADQEAELRDVRRIDAEVRERGWRP